MSSSPAASPRPWLPPGYRISLFAIPAASRAFFRRILFSTGTETSPSQCQIKDGGKSGLICFSAENLSISSLSCSLSGSVLKPRKLFLLFLCAKGPVKVMKLKKSNAPPNWLKRLCKQTNIKI